MQMTVEIRKTPAERVLLARGRVKGRLRTYSA